jgi:glycosyltransferase involved in cell wall biosynthesis
MRLLVYPNSMEIGGSQLNAVELAAALRDRGHEVVVYSEPGPLVDKVRELGLDHVPRLASRIRPGPATALDLRRVVTALGIDVIHGYEWPPILEAYAAASTCRGRAVAVGTVMSMSVAPFIPSSLPLVVGTANIRDRSSAVRRGPVVLLEPPVDTRANHPDAVFHPPHPVDHAGSSVPQVVVVSRIVRELKLEGILTAVGAVGQIASRRPVRLIIVGDGAAFGDVAAAARRVNETVGSEVVVLTGETPDPRWAYSSADICLGMGGSALRALAFAKPLVVQGEAGFFELLTPDTAEMFLKQGWYGVAGVGSSAAQQRLVGLLNRLLDDQGLRETLGRFGRRLVHERFSLEGAAAKQEQIYEAALDGRAPVTRLLADSAHSGLGLATYKVRRRADRLRGRLAVDDFNAHPV